MKKKIDLENYKIDYAGKKYNIDLYGPEDSETEGGLWDLAGKCAEVIINELDGDGYFPCAEEDTEQARATAQEEIYRLVKFYMLRPLDRQLNNQNEM